MKKFLLVALPLALVAATTIVACGRRSTGGGQAQLLSIAQARRLSPDDAARALKTFVPPGGRDEYLLFASGGHSGQVHVLGVPSMRLLKTIAVFTPEPWQGYGYGADWSRGLARRWRAGHGHTPTATAMAMVTRRQRRREGCAALGRCPPSRAERDRRQVRRTLALHQRPRPRPDRDGRPLRLPRQADSPGPQPADLARRHLRHARHASTSTSRRRSRR